VDVSSKLPLWLRWSGLGTGVLTLAWFPIEDTQTIYLTVLSLLWSAWMAGWLATRPRVRGWLVGRWRFPLLGAGPGLLTAPVALGLVLFKAGIHAHGFLDFSVYQLTGIFARTPIWVILGCVVGIVIYQLDQAKTS
jgi:hypothetical protein